MIAPPPGTKVFLACRPIDLRAGFDGLAAKLKFALRGMVFGRFSAGCGL
jgi:hypothetical protein